MPGAIVHEWIEKHGGSEKVLDRFAANYPSAEILCLWDDSEGRYRGRQVQESWLARTPLRRSKAVALPFMPIAWRGWRNLECEWLLVSSHAFAHHVRLHADKGVPKLLYVHSPARYLWCPELDIRGRSVFGRLTGPALRCLDRRRAAESTAIAANSLYIHDRIERTWGLPSTVIYPPVAVREIQAVLDWRDELTAEEADRLASLPRDYVFGASRLVSYKRLDVVIDAGASVGLPVVIAGSGPELERLRAKADDSYANVTFIGRVSDAMLYALYQRALVYVFPGIEDFGIMPVEAMACGTPVVAYAEGGARESVDVAGGGAIIENYDRSSIHRAVEAACGLSRIAVSAGVRVFDTQVFDSQLVAWVDSSLGGNTDRARDGRLGPEAHCG